MSSSNSNSGADDPRTRTGDDARHKTEQKLRQTCSSAKFMRQRRVPDEFRHPCQRSRIGRQLDIRLLFTERGLGKKARRTSTAHKPEHYVVHGCQHRPEEAGRCADRLLEVVEKRACWELATAWVCALRESVHVRHCGSEVSFSRVSFRGGRERRRVRSVVAVTCREHTYRLSQRKCFPRPRIEQQRTRWGCQRYGPTRRSTRARTYFVYFMQSPFQSISRTDRVCPIECIDG